MKAARCRRCRRWRRAWAWNTPRARGAPAACGGLWRLVAAQHRHANGQGNVVDNLLAKNYAEHPNLAGNAGFGYPGGVRINEPGRTLWLRADLQF
mgnify:CR=1 FL=1